MKKIPCNCGHTYKQHFYVETANLRPCGLRNKAGDWLDFCENFTPMTNLEYMEMLYEDN